MGRSCGHCCGCCDCIEVIEEFAIKLGGYKQFDSRYFTEELEVDSDGNSITDPDTGRPKKKPRCKVAKVMNGYTVSEPCTETGLSDKKTACNSNCSSSERHWYIIEEDNCKIHRQGNISCDGAFLDLDEVFRYAVFENNIVAGVFEEPIQVVPADCDLYANFSLVTCCSDPTKKGSFPDDALCEASIAEPICEACTESRRPIATKRLLNRNYNSPNQYPASVATWDLCQYFNVVGVANKLYNTFPFSYNGKCPVACNDTNEMVLASNENRLHPKIIYDANGNFLRNGEEFTRNYRRFWAIHEYPVISPELNKCCGVILKGEIDEHGRLLPPSVVYNQASGPFNFVSPPVEVEVPGLPDTCDYCIDGSWHCDPRITVRLAGLINNEETGILDITTDIKVSDIVSEEGLDPRINQGIPIFCCSRKGNIASLRNIFRAETPIYVWRPHYLPAEEGEDPFDITKRKIEYRLEPVEPEDDLHIEIVLNYKTEYGPQKFLETSLAVSAYFEMKLNINTANFVQDLVIESQRICPTTDGKIDCNVLNGEDGLVFDNIVSSNYSFLGVNYSKIVNLDEIESIVTSSLTIMKKPKTIDVRPEYCVTTSTIVEEQGECGFQLIWDGLHKSVADPIFRNSDQAKTFALSICCCDTIHLVKLNTDIPVEERTEIGCAGLTPECEESTEVGIRCRCTQFDPIIMCSLSNESELGVIIIDEASRDYTESCVCANNIMYNQDLAFFREKAPETDIVLLQPTISDGPCGAGKLGWLCGGCPLPEEVIDYRTQVIRNDPEGTFELLKTIFYLHVQGGINGTGRPLYSAMNIYRDISGSVRDAEFFAGTKLFLDWILEFHPDFPVTDITFGNERWLLYAAQNKSGVKCFGRYTGPGCNSNVYINEPPPARPIIIS